MEKHYKGDDEGPRIPLNKIKEFGSFDAEKQSNGIDYQTRMKQIKKREKEDDDNEGPTGLEAKYNMRFVN